MGIREVKGGKERKGKALHIEHSIQLEWRRKHWISSILSGMAGKMVHSRLIAGIEV